MQIDLLSYGLKADPFTLQPASVVINWAGRSSEKQLLTDIVTTPLATDIGTSEFTVVHGEYGCGKSHALRYCESMVNDWHADHFRSVAIYVPDNKNGSEDYICAPLSRNYTAGEHEPTC